LHIERRLRKNAGAVIFQVPDEHGSHGIGEIGNLTIPISKTFRASSYH